MYPFGAGQRVQFIISGHPYSGPMINLKPGILSRSSRICTKVGCHVSGLHNEE